MTPRRRNDTDLCTGAHEKTETTRLVIDVEEANRSPVASAVVAITGWHGRLPVGAAPYGEEIKKCEEDINSVMKRVNELTGDHPLQVARCTKIINADSEEPKYIINVKQFAKFVVDLADTVAPTDIEEGMRVGVDRTKYQIHIPLPPKIDPSVTMMQVEDKPDVTYSDVGGCKEQIEKLREVVELPLLHPEKFVSLGIEPPKGVLLFGPPGTGKTLCARAVANRTDACFIRVIGSELVQKYVGEGARFDDGAGGDNEVQRTMLELINQLDGFDPRGNIKVLMATNRPDTLDPALVRPGRLDRKVEFGLPDLEGRTHIFKIHARSMSVEKDIRYELLARLCPNSTGAEIRSVCTEAGMFAIRARCKMATEKDFLDAGPARFTVSEAFVRSTKVEVGTHFQAILLQLALYEDNMGDYTVSSGAILVFLEESLVQVVVGTTEGNAGEDRPCNVEQRDSSVIVTELPVPFPREEIDDCRNHKILSEFSLAPHPLEYRSFPAAFDPLVDCRQFYLHVQTSKLNVQGILSFEASLQPAVLKPDPDSPFWQPLAKYPGLTRPNFVVSTPPRDVVHHIRTNGFPVFSRAAVLRLHSFLPPRPSPSDFLGALFGKSVFQKIYLVGAFHQIHIAPENVSKTAPATSFGLLVPARAILPHSASQTFQPFVDRVPNGLSFVHAYTDFLVASSSACGCWEHFPTVLDRLQQFDFVPNPSKCVFKVSSPEFLRHLVHSNCIRPLPSKIAAIRKFPPSPHSQASTAALFGMVNFGHQFLQ
ncbi:26S protease regulatory subunit 7 [Sparganum proliferum]